MQDYSARYSYNQGKIEHKVNNEIKRQLYLQKEGKFQYIAYDEECPELVRLAMLTEELGEVARAIQNADPQNKKDELIQVAAIAISWAARLEEDGVQ
jgi:NTP pyrophosphatase (non-canonical NTP hydrolase)